MKKNLRVSSFGNTRHPRVDVYRPERDKSLGEILHTHHQPILPRGKGLSYGDVCFNDTVISTERLNRIIALQKDTNQITVEPAVTFNELIHLDKHLIPPVIPGTVHASIGGGVANDVHGKNHTHQGALGSHINWMSLQLPQGTINTSPTENADLFYATIGGLGLTGFIKQINMNLHVHSKRLKVKRLCFNDIYHCVNLLQTKTREHDYAAAWCDFYRRGRGILFLGDHILANAEATKKTAFSIPFTPPISLVTKWGMRHFNAYYYRQTLRHPTMFKQNLSCFNNPLDSVKHFNRLYGRKGFFQLQCVVPFEGATAFMEQCLALFNQNRTYPSLAVAKRLGQKGKGYLSFTEPGITFAFDFNYRHKRLIQSLYTLLIEFQGKVYLAKDELLDKSLFRLMYPNYEAFINVLDKYGVYPYFQSAMSKRLGIHA